MALQTVHGKISFLFLSFLEVGGVTNNIACNLERRFNSETSLKTKYKCECCHYKRVEKMWVLGMS